LLEGRLAIVCSKTDPASVNIKDKLLKLMGFRRLEESIQGEEVYELDEVLLITIARETIHAEDLEDFLRVGGIIFASRHAAESGVPAFLAHTPGNWTDEAFYGGRPRSICIAMPIHLARIVRALDKLREEEGFSDWRCGLEVTHHGPYLEHTPAMFVELGSTQKEWYNDKAAEVVARAIEEALDALKERPVAVGFGGPHYAPQFSRVVLSEELAISHIVPKYAFPKVGARELRLAIERSLVRPSIALIDWKSLKSNERQMVIGVCDEAGLPVRKI
jgi:D-aminoacyl-tRNA deacylase